MTFVKTALKNVLERRGYKVVRVATPAPSATSAPARHERPDRDQAFFPEDPVPERVNPWPIPADLAAINMPWAKVLVDLYQKPASWPACVSPETGLLIYSLVRNIRPTTIVETGTCHGASTIWIAAAMEMTGGPGVIHTFDDFLTPSDPELAARPLFQNREAKVRARFLKSGLMDRIVVHRGDSASCVTAAREQIAGPGGQGGVQLAFIDGDHSMKGVVRDWAAIEPMLSIGGYLLLHDVWPETCPCDGPRWLADNINTASTGKYQACDFYTAPMNYGLSVARRVR